MDGRDYVDFELEIGYGSGNDYTVAVLSSPAGEAREVMSFPFGELVLESRLKDLQIALLRYGGTRRKAPSKQEQTVQDFGQQLFDSLLIGEVRSRYDVSLRAAGEQGKGLRLKLRIQPPELTTLPWEFLYDPREAEYVCLSRNTPVVRYLELPQPIEPVAVSPPLRILGMVASPKDQPELDSEREKRRMERALQDLQSEGLVDLVWLEGETWRDLQRAMRGGPWHVFHFSGHSGFDRVTDEGYVVLADREGRTQDLTATQLGRLLADHDPLRLVLLNSCEGAQGSERDVFSSTAAILMRRGIPAVLAMQYEITDMAAVEFAQAFYEALVDGLTVDSAVAEARKAVSVSVANTVEWGVPVLYMRSPDLRIIGPETVSRKRVRSTTALARGEEALAMDAFEEAIRQYAFVLSKGPNPYAEERKELAEQARAALDRTKSLASAPTGTLEDQARAVTAVLGQLKGLEAKLPGSQAIQEALEQTWHRAYVLRDQLWDAGKRLLAAGTAGLSIAQRQAQMQESIHLLQLARGLDRENLPALQQDLARAENRLSRLQRVEGIVTEAEQRLGVAGAAALPAVMASLDSIKDTQGIWEDPAFRSAVSLLRDRHLDQAEGTQDPGEGRRWLEIARTAPLFLPLGRTARLDELDRKLQETAAPAEPARQPRVPPLALLGGIAVVVVALGLLAVFLPKILAPGPTPSAPVAAPPDSTDTPGLPATTTGPGGLASTPEPATDSDSVLPALGTPGQTEPPGLPTATPGPGDVAWTPEPATDADSELPVAGPPDPTDTATAIPPTATPTPTITPIPPTATPPGGGRIAFVSNRDGDSEIYVMTSDGLNLTRLTDNPDEDGQPAWSPDGSRIAFWTDRDRDQEIYVMDADGSNQTRLTFEKGKDYDPAWSPDGRYIAFTSERDGNPEIYLMNPDGSGQTNLTRNRTSDQSPSWSPDSRQIAFHSYRRDNTDIYVMGVQGGRASGTPTRLTSHPAKDRQPSWSRNGDQIAFVSLRNDPNPEKCDPCNREIYVMAADGSGQTRLTSNQAEDRRPDWSPDDAWIVFYSGRDGAYEIYLMAADGTGQTNLTHDPSKDYNPAWSWK